LSLRSEDLDSVGELYTEDDFRQLVVAIEATPVFLGRRGALDLLTRISHTIGWIGAANQRKLLCSNNLARLAERPGAHRVYPGSVRICTVEAREIVAAFDAGAITSDAGAPGATDRAINMVSRFAALWNPNASPLGASCYPAFGAFQQPKCGCGQAPDGRPHPLPNCR
jgi:hypothetical protein